MADSADSEVTPSSLQINYSRSDSWFDALKRYVQESDVSTLDLSNMQLNVSEVTSVLEFLADSHITELDLSCNNLQNHMKSLSRLLIKTKIKKLNVGETFLKHGDVASLMKVLKETQITDLNISESEFHVGEFIPFLQESQLTILNLADCEFLHFNEEALLFIQALRNTSLTHLDLTRVLRSISPDTFFSLFVELERAPITHLSLYGCGTIDFKRLGDCLRNSMLIELDLGKNKIEDDGVDDLFQALIGSKVTSLKLENNGISGNNNLGLFLKDTQLISLDVSCNSIQNARMFSFPDVTRSFSVESLKLNGCHLQDEIAAQLIESLRYSKLTHLEVSGNCFGFNSITALTEIVKATSVTHLDLSQYYNFNYDLAEAIILIGDLLIQSKLKHLDVSCGFFHLSNHPLIVSEFLKKLTNSPVTLLNMNYFARRLGRTGAEIISPILANTHLTHLNLGNNDIGDGIVTIAANLKFSAITHLNMAQNKITDKCTTALAESLKETHIIDISLSDNEITCLGATALAQSLKESKIMSLNLDSNEIGTDGMEALAKHAQGSFITVINVNQNPGNKYLVEEVIWNNRRHVQQLVSCFKQIAPETRESAFRFENNVNDVDKFLDACLILYKAIIECPSAPNVIAQKSSSSFSGDQISGLLYHEFPKQFSWFISSKIEAEFSAHLTFLRKVEALGLNRIVECLLLNRPIYTIDEVHGILHPYVYKLLKKYELPICNLNVEPLGLERIIKYFTEFSTIEGAAEVVTMLKNTSKVAVKEKKTGSLECASNSTEKEVTNEEPITKKRRKEI